MKGLIKDVIEIELHNGKCGIQGFCNLTHTGTYKQDISSSAALFFLSVSYKSLSFMETHTPKLLACLSLAAF